jgi:hypothetical protein
MKNEIKRVFEDQIMDWLTNKNLRSLLIRENRKTLAETSFDLLIRWYPQIATDGCDSYGLDILGRIENSLVTEKAQNLLLEICENFSGTKKELKNRLKKAVHFEHNSPVDVVKNKLLMLQDIKIENVRHILNDGYAIVIITKEEENLLRSKKLIKTGDFLFRLESIGASLISEKSKNDLINSLRIKLK